jgi:hypothetical protein
MHIQGCAVEIQTPTHWNLIGRSIIARRLCYRPAIFFLHLSVTALLCPQKNIRRAFKKYYFVFFTFLKNYLILKLRK